MNKDLILKCLIAFILGYLLSRQLGNRIGNNFSIGCEIPLPNNKSISEIFNDLPTAINDINSHGCNLSSGRNELIKCYQKILSLRDNTNYTMKQAIEYYDKIQQRVQSMKGDIVKYMKTTHKNKNKNKNLESFSLGDAFEGMGIAGGIVATTCLVGSAVGDTVVAPESGFFSYGALPEEEASCGAVGLALS